MYSKRLFACAFFGLLLASLGTAHASTIVVSNSLGPQTTNINTTLPVAQFDPSLGTLT